MIPLLIALALLISIPASNFNDNRTNWNAAETQLTPTFVESGSFGLRGSYAVDSYITSQPLYLEGVTVSGVSRNLLIVATLNNSVYAFDASNPGSSPVWSNLAFASTRNIGSGIPGAQVGCMSTPAADLASSRLYVVCMTNTPNWILRQIDLGSGSTLQTVTIAGQVIGTGDPGGGDTTSGPNLLFNPPKQLQRTGLALANGNVYIGFGSYGDSRPYHGWMIAYSTSTFLQTGIWCASPNGWGGAFWAGAPSFDGSGNLYATTGNGTDYDGLTNFTNSAIKFSPALSMLDWFEPSNNVSINAVDADTGSNWALLVPGTTKVVVAGKSFDVFLLDTDCMGHLQGSSGCTLQTFKSNPGGTAGNQSGSYSMAYANGSLFLPTSAGLLYGFAFSSGSFTTTPFATNTYANAFPGPAQLAVSSNAASAGILWVITSTSSLSGGNLATGVLRALNPATLAEYWNSSPRGRTDGLGNVTKFTAPVVAGGKVFVATESFELQEFGFTAPCGLRGQNSIRGTAVIR
jgi:hypothetical protein